MEKSAKIYNQYFGEGTGKENYVHYALEYAKYIEKNHSRKIGFRCVFHMREVTEKQARYIIHYVESNSAIQSVKDFFARLASN